MPVLKTDSNYGRCCPPDSDYALTTNIPGWDTWLRYRGGDMGVLAGVKHFYSRILPWSKAAELMSALKAKLGLPPGRDVYAFTSFRAPSTARAYATRPVRGDNRMSEDELSYRCVDIAGVRLYLVIFPAAKVASMKGTWQNSGVGVSVRLAEKLLPHVDSVVDVRDIDPASPPEPVGLAETVAHRQLRERISWHLNLARSAPAPTRSDAEGTSEAGHATALAAPDPGPGPDDIFLFPTGMAAIFYTLELLRQYKPDGVGLMLGSVYRDTFHHIAGEFKYHHFTSCGGSDGLDRLETWLEAARREAKAVSFLFCEFPCNPLLESCDLRRLRRLALEHHFVLVIDDTVGGFCNIDLLPYADVLVTSLTKSFSGYANVMGGAVTLNPAATATTPPPHHAALRAALASSFHNELFSADAAVLLANSDDYLARSRRSNRNAAAMADFLHRFGARDSGSPVTRVRYPTLLPDRPNYDAVLRASTSGAALPEPGYGCLLTVEFESTATAVAFHDRLDHAFFPSPHLGATRSLVFCYNMVEFGKAHEADYHRAYGILTEAVRISAGLEDIEDLVDSLRHALDAAAEEKKKQQGSRQEQQVP